MHYTTDIRERLKERGIELSQQAIDDVLNERSKSSRYGGEIFDAYLEVLQERMSEHFAALRSMHQRHVEYKLPRRGGKQVRAAQE